MEVLADVYILLRAHVTEVGVAILLLFLLSKLIPLLLEQWRMYQAFKHIPAAYEDQHFLLGHTPM